MDFDDEARFLDPFGFATHRKASKGPLVPCDWPSLTADDLLSMPATAIARERRNIAAGGRSVVVGDNVDTLRAVLRVPDIEAEVSDYKPHLDYSAWNEAPKPLIGKYKINRRIANRGIAPRVAEPKLPPQTKTTALESTTDGLSLSSVENAILKATQAVQLTKRVGGQHQELAALYGKMWGAEGLLDAEAPVDVLGDISLPRVLAKSSKRRFEVYRNIGFTSIVSAGSSQANPKSYGSSALINWQRRTELAKLFVHFAQALEGAELNPSMRFSMTARIPAHTVPHLLWSDLAMRFDASKYPVAANQGMYTKAAVQFAQHGILTALVRVSDHVRALGFDVADLTAGAAAALKFDRLIYLEPLKFPKKQLTDKPELEFAQYSAQMLSGPAVSKSHDMRVALVEALVGRDPTAMAPLHTLRSLEALRRITGIKKLKDSWDWAVDMLKELPLLVAVANQIAQRPETYEQRHRKGEWIRIYGQQMPLAIQMNADAYTSIGVAAATLWTVLVDKSAQVTRTVAFHSAAMSEHVSAGIRRKRSLLVRGDVSLTIAINQEVLAGNRAFYRERYRRAGRVWQILAAHVKDPGKSEACVLESAWWFARSDLANGVSLNIESTPPEPVISEKKIKSMIAVYLWSLKQFTGDRRRKMSELTLDAAYQWASEVASGTHVAHGLRDYPLMLESAVERLLEAQRDDYVPLVEEHVTKKAEGPGTDTRALFGGSIELPTFGGDTVDHMVSYWIAQSGQGAFLDEDEVDEFTKWLDKHLIDEVDNLETYIRVHSAELSTRDAGNLLDEWWEKWEDGVLAGNDGGASKFDIQ